jgi:nucleotide-binding universal stress UspA family protein
MRYLAPEAEHELIHVVDLPELPGPLRAFGGKREQVRLNARNSASTRLEELRDLGGCPAVGAHVQSGRPAAEILRLADDVDADLIVVGEQGPKHGVAALLGSTAERVLFDSAVPVLVARRVPDSPPRSLLVGIDASEASERVLTWAAELVDRFDARATVINVVDRLLLTDDLTGMPEVEELRQLEGEAVAAMRDWLRQRVDEEGLPSGRVQSKVALGDPSYEIIAEAQRIGADLVMLGSRGGDIARTPLIGRIVNKVVRSAPCSVLVVPARRSEE